SPGLDRLLRLSIGASGIGKQGLIALMTSPHLANLVIFDFQGAQFGVAAEATAEAIARSTLPNLRYVHVSDPNREDLVQKCRTNIPDVSLAGLRNDPPWSLETGQFPF